MRRVDRAQAKRDPRKSSREARLKPNNVQFCIVTVLSGVPMVWLKCPSSPVLWEWLLLCIQRGPGAA